MRDISGIGMHGMSLWDLLTLQDEHKDKPLFASKKATQTVIDSRGH